MGCRIAVYFAVGVWGLRLKCAERERDAIRGLGFGVWGLGFGVWGLGLCAYMTMRAEMRRKALQGE